MPVEADQLEIINAALLIIGDDPITALADTDERAELANQIYEFRLNEALARARWRFAARQVQLVVNGTAPLARWTTAHDLPDGTPDPVPLAILAVLVDDEPISFDRYGSQIYSDAAATDEVYIDYMFRPEEANFGARFKGAFIDMLAADFAIAKSKDMARELANRAEAKFKLAASLEAQERTNRKLPTQRFIAGRRFWTPGGAGAAARRVANESAGGAGGTGSGTVYLRVEDGNYGDILVSGNGLVWTFQGTFDADDIGAGAITTVKIADEAITLAKIADGTAGDLLYWDALGEAVALAIGATGQVLTVNGSGLPTWATPGAASADFTGITLEASGTLALADEFVFYDVSLADSYKITLQVIFDSINLLTADATPDGAADYVMTYDASAGVAKKVLLNNLPSAAAGGATTVGPVATTSGTAVTLATGLSGVTRMAIQIENVSTNGTSEAMIQLGDSGGIETTGYVSDASDGGGTQSSSGGFLLARNVASSSDLSGNVWLTKKPGTNTWVIGGAVSENGVTVSTAGSKTLSASLTQLRITTAIGDTFDQGSVSIFYWTD